MRRKENKHLEFLSGKLDLAPVLCDAEILCIYFQSADDDHSLCGRRLLHFNKLSRASSYIRLDSRKQHFYRKRLCDIVVGAEVKPHYLIYFLFLCRNHYYRRGEGFSYFATDGKAVALRKHYIEKDEVKIACQRFCKPLFAVEGGIAKVACHCQVDFQQH